MKTLYPQNREESIELYRDDRTGKVSYAVLGWLIGLPLPIVIILLFVRGCDVF